MRAAPLALIAASLIAAAHAAPECTSEPRGRWMGEAGLRAQLKSQGYQVKKFKATKHCYEIYGHDKAGRKVLVYFNPVSGQVVKTRVDS